MGQKSNWNGAHVRLRRIYDERLPEGMTQKAFGSKFDIGSQSMVAQYLSGTRPLNYEAAAKFAKGLGCTIYDISPEMADSLKDDILPVLGRALRRAAALACFALIPLTAPSPAEAAFFGSSRPPTVYYVKLRRRIIRWIEALSALFGGAAAAACTTIDEHTAPPADWPKLELFEHHVPHAEMRDQCVQWGPWWASPEACAIVNFEAMRCDIWFSADFPPLRTWIEHEYMHCAGYDHPGDPVLATAWQLHKATAAGKAIAEAVR